VNPTTARAAPADMSLIFSATASKSETFFVRPVASRTKTGALEFDKKNEVLLR